MARKRKMTDEALLDIIKDYLDRNMYITKIKYSDLVKHGNKIGYDNLIYHDFSRNKTVKEFVELFNEKHDISNYFKIDNDESINKLNFNVDSIVDKYYKDINKLKIILKVYKKNYDNAFDRINSLEVQNEELIKKIEEQEKQIKTLKDKNSNIKDEYENMKDKINLEEKRIDKEFIIKGINFLLDMGKVTTLNKEELTDVLKNLGYTSDNDLLEYEEITKDLRNTEDIADKKQNNIVKLESRKSKIQLPDFMK